MLAKQALQLIKTRRTCRSFDKFTPVSDKALENILEAALWAPLSIYQLQNRKFVVLKNQAREQAAALLSSDPSVLKYMRYMYEHQPWGREADWETKAAAFAVDIGAAPVMILALAQKNANVHKMEHNVASLWCAAQNMMLQAHAEGLDTGVVTFLSEKIKEDLLRAIGFSWEEWAPVYILNVGEAVEEPLPLEREAENTLVILDN